MNALFSVLALAMLVEVITEYIKKMIPFVANHTWCVFAITIVLGILGAFTGNVDIFSELGFYVQIKYIGIIMTGILCAGGSNVIYDLFDKLHISKEA